LRSIVDFCSKIEASPIEISIWQKIGRAGYVALTSRLYASRTGRTTKRAYIELWYTHCQYPVLTHRVYSSTQSLALGQDSGRSRELWGDRKSKRCKNEGAIQCTCTYAFVGLWYELRLLSSRLVVYRFLISSRLVCRLSKSNIDPVGGQHNLPRGSFARYRLK